MNVRTKFEVRIFIHAWVAKKLGQSLAMPTLPIPKNPIGLHIQTIPLWPLVLPQFLIGVLGVRCEPPPIEGKGHWRSGMVGYRSKAR